jgi:hypothetical protein
MQAADDGISVRTRAADRSKPNVNLAVHRKVGEPLSANTVVTAMTGTTSCSWCGRDQCRSAGADKAMRNGDRRGHLPSDRHNAGCIDHADTIVAGHHDRKGSCAIRRVATVADQLEGPTVGRRLRGYLQLLLVLSALL